MSEETELNFFEKFLKIVDRLHVKKDLVNPFTNSSYRNAESILREVKPLCMEYGLYIHTTKEIIQIGDKNYVKAIVKITDFEEELSSVGYAQEPMSKPKLDESQVTGSASSYAKKYALCDLLMIDDGRDDPDNPDSSNEEPDMTVEMISGHQLAVLKQEAISISSILGEEPSVYTDQLAKRANVKSIEYFPKEYFNEAFQTLSKWKLKAIQNQETKPKAQVTKPKQSNVFN